MQLILHKKRFCSCLSCNKSKNRLYYLKILLKPSIYVGELMGLKKENDKPILYKAFQREDCLYLLNSSANAIESK